MSKLPAIQFYPGDWRKDPGVQALSFHDRGVWFEILLLMHESDDRGKLLLNGLKMPDDALARLLGLDKQNLTTTLTTLLEYGVASRCEETGAIMCRRMVRDENLRKVRVNAGKLGGNPILLKQNPTTGVKQKRTTGVKQIPTPSSSPSGEDVLDSEKHKIDQFAEFWNTCPRKTAKAKAMEAWNKALKKADPEKIIVGMKSYALSMTGKDPQYIAHPATWLNGERWEDEQPVKNDRFSFWKLPLEEREAFVKREMFSP